ncbi:hypothetical protein GGH92_002792 [Coemansia sp. RSA 2673]|nr:hypothetical protein GGH92_002792 [Coemansia sp. RSA 2673]
MNTWSLPCLLLLFLLSHTRPTGAITELEHNDSTAVAEYINVGTEHHILISKVDTEQVLSTSAAISDKDTSNLMEADTAKKHPVNNANDNVTDGSAIFNLDNLLDLMAGDDNGDVDFNAIVLELTSNLGNVIDINEVGNMAATLGIMMSGMGAVAELQRQGVLDIDTELGSIDANNALNNGLAALVGQLLADQRLPGILNTAAGAAALNGMPARAPRDAGGVGTNLDGLGIAQLLNDIASNGAGDANMSGLNQLVGNFASAYAQGSNSNQGDVSNISNLVGNLASGAQGGNIADTIGSVIGSNGVRSITSALSDFVNGNDSANFTGIAQALGIRNFVRSDDKRVPEGCPSLVHVYVQLPTDYLPILTAKSNIACLSPLDEGMRPAAKSGHCHQDTECSPGWGGWNCNSK